MVDRSHTFGGGLAETTANPAVLGAIVIGVLLTLVLPRKYAIIPVLLGALLVPLGQSVYALGVHWFVYRILILGGVARVIAIRCTTKRPLLSGGLTAVDYAFVSTALCQATAFVLLYMEPDALVNQFGFLIDFLGAGLVLRALIREEADVHRTLRCVAFIVALVAAGMVHEQLTGRNVFGSLGGVRATSEVREGRIRSQGVFQHPITAGTFGATLIPLFMLLWRDRKFRIAASTGIVACTVMTVCSNSSTPLLAYVAGLFGVCLWPLRKHMRTLRIGVVVTLIALHLAMKAPVWFLIARVDLTGGSSGYHRAELVDQCIRHFADWWVLGAKDTVNWGWDMWDTQNEFVNVAVTGGLLALVSFILVISRTFAGLGAARKAVEGATRNEWKTWLVGCSVFAYVVAFFGFNWFDQSKIGWFLLLAIASVICAEARCEYSAVKASRNIAWITSSEAEVTNCR